jgi:hypothetical protein
MTPHQASRFYLRLKSQIKALLLGFALFFSFLAKGQESGISGVIYDIDGKPLPFASVFFPDLKLGASTNIEGVFRMAIPPGKHALVIQFLGFQTMRDSVEVPDSGFVKFTYNLYPQTVILREAAVSSRKEDPAYAIMRNAIAKARFHRMQYDKYSCRVYTKGTGMVKKAPRLIARQMRKEGVQLNEAYTSESIIEVTFEQPNKISERVIAINERKDERSPSPAPYINQSFYNAEVVGGVSPLSPAAFYYYRFAYLGGFEDNGAWVNKIRVTPKTPGEGVFDGTIFIIENTWAIHSLDFTTVETGFTIKLSQLHSPVQNEVWMPVKHTLTFSGSVFGVEVEAVYNAVVSNYQLTLNETLMAAAKDAVAALPPMEDEQEPEAKAYKKVAKEAERAQRKAQDMMVVSERTFKVDSLARKQDSLFWHTNRPIPLTAQETQGYSNADSLAIVEGLDSTDSRPGRRLKPQDVLFGGRYRLGKNTRVEWKPTLTQTRFNPAEGVVFQSEAEFNKWVLRKTNFYRVEITPTIRYGVASETGMAKVVSKISTKKNLMGHDLTFSGGRFIRQYNEQEPISPFVNMLYSLFFRENYMAIFRQDYFEGTYHKDIRRKVEFWIGGGVYDRRPMANQSDFSFFYNNTRDYLPNMPAPEILGESSANRMPNHRLATFHGKVLIRPFITYRIRNGMKLANADNTPEFSVSYRKGFYDTGFGFDHLQFSWEQSLPFRISGYLGWRIQAGTFFNTAPLLPDLAHFNGNQTIFSPFGEMTGYRMLPYYQFSTRSWYVDQQYHYEFRKLLLSQFQKIRFLGVKEQVFFSVLTTGDFPEKPFVEVGYAADRIYRIFRFELAVSNRFSQPAFRVGLSTLFSF